MPGFSLPSFAKINWMLRVLAKRRDGFHDLFTVFQTISLHDTLLFEPAADLVLTCDDPSVVTDHRNLILKAAGVLRTMFHVKEGAAIHLTKRIPSPGGLGGGSSNAAIALIGLKKLWELDETIDLHSIVEDLGSDAPFFLYGGTAVGTGRGEKIEPITDKQADLMLIVTPDVNVFTKDAFQAVELLAALTSEARNHTLTVCRNEADQLDPLHSVLINDLERTVFSAHPEIKRVKDTLLVLGAVNAAMSGSGATVFAVFDKQETRQAAIKALDQESTWRKFAVSTISRSEYLDALS
jgi:4-diphosphocytidyl-2-C-methyl-D-erythritol kinase